LPVVPLFSGRLPGHRRSRLSPPGCVPSGFRLRAPSFNVVGSGCLGLSPLAPFAFNRRPASRI
jgi:hypothetical protein